MISNKVIPDSDHVVGFGLIRAGKNEHGLKLLFPVTQVKEIPRELSLYTIICTRHQTSRSSANSQVKAENPYLVIFRTATDIFEL